MIQVTIYPHFNALYYSYFLQGIGDAFGWNNVRLSRKGFPDFGHDCLAFRVAAGGRERRIYIHAHDSTTLAPDALEWCHAFGKVNLDLEVVPPEHQHKIVPTGPVFPVRLWSPARGAWLAFRNLVVANRRLRSYRLVDDDPADRPADRSIFECWAVHLLQYLRIYRYQRLPFEGYYPGTSDPRYIFFSSGLWPEEHPVPEHGAANREANQNRLAFIEACRALSDVRFEGGFWKRKRVHVDNYEAYTSPVEYDHATYIDRTRASAVVFNTPAFKGCHSWKLAEFLALGKAIISVPIAREMPAPLRHGVNAHIVDGSVGSIRDAVERICRDADYRGKLESGARQYYDAWLRPATMIRRLANRADVVASERRGRIGEADSVLIGAGEP